MATRVKAIDVPSDGSCLFHSIALPLKVKGNDLRTVVLHIVQKYYSNCFNGVDIIDWLRWDGYSNQSDYIKQNTKSTSWGGAFEMSILSTFLNLNITVYEKQRSHVCKKVLEVVPDEEFMERCGLKKIPKKSGIMLLWVNKSHYMSLILT